MKSFLLLYCTFILNGLQLHAQPVDEKQLLKFISNHNEKRMADYDSTLTAIYENADSAARVQLLDFYTSNSTSSDPYTAARSLIWQATMLNRPPFKKDDYNGLQQLFMQAINLAIKSGDEYLLEACFESMAYHNRNYAKSETALFYFLKAAELRRKLGDGSFVYKNEFFYSLLVELLYRMQDYEQAKQYAKLIADMPVPVTAGKINATNTVALCYQRTGRYDSALNWYARAMEMSENPPAPTDKMTFDAWKAIINGNIGAVYFEQKQYDRALPLLWSDYYGSEKAGERNSAGNTLHRIALIYLYQNKKDSALLLARSALGLTSGKRDDGYNINYVRNAHFALSEIFKTLGQADSVLYYGTKYDYLKDSINLAVAQSRTDIVQTRLDFEKSVNRISSLEKQKKAEETKRNLLLAFIPVLIIIGWLIYNRQRLKHRHEQQLILQEKQYAEQQLQLFTQSLIEKNSLIEELNLQLQQTQQAAGENLYELTILTDDDWQHFQQLFEKAQPGFFGRIKKQAPDITAAELRLAAIIRLGLDNKQTASMQGISLDTVRKSKLRLRQRLGIEQPEQLEPLILQL